MYFTVYVEPRTGATCARYVDVDPDTAHFYGRLYLRTAVDPLAAPDTDTDTPATWQVEVDGRLYLLPDTAVAALGATLLTAPGRPSTLYYLWWHAVGRPNAVDVTPASLT